MVLKEDQQRVKALLKDTITLLCRNGLHYKCQFSIDALIGITLDEDNVFLVSINETVSDGTGISKKDIIEASEVGDAQSPAVSDTSDNRAGSRPRSRDSGIDQHSHRDSSGSPVRQSQEPLESKKPVKLPSVSGASPKRKRRSSKDSVLSDSESRSSNTIKHVKVEENLPDGSSFVITTDDVIEGMDRKKQSISTVQESDNDDSIDNIVIIKDEDLSGDELELIQNVSPGAALDHSSQTMPSGGEPMPGCSTWAQQGHTPTSFGSPPEGGSSSQVLPEYVNFATDFSYLRQREARFVCPHCPDSAYVNKKSLNRHIRAKHPMICEDWMKCQLCSQSFSLTKNLREHTKSQHQLVEEEIRFTCTLCETSVLTARELSNHFRVTHNRHPYTTQMDFPPN